MAIQASSIPREKIAQRRDQYDTLTQGRELAPGITNDGTAVDPFDRNYDGSYSVNPWTHADNQSPWRGNVTFKNYKGENETVAGWQADRAFSANLGLTGFEDISNQLSSLQESFTSSLQEQSNLGFANLGKLTGKGYMTTGRGGRIKKG